MFRALLTLCTLALSLASAGAQAFDSLTVLALFRDKAMVEIDGKQTLLVVGKEGPEGVRLIAADSRGALIEVNGERKSYPLGQRISSTYAPPTGKTIVQVAPSGEGGYFVDGTMEGFAVRYLIDTGADTVAMNRHQARRIGLDYRLVGRKGTAETASGTAEAYMVTLKKITVGAIALQDVEAIVVDSDYPKDVLLGNTALDRLGMVRHGRILELHGR